MEDIGFVLVLFGGYIFVMRYVLPKFGVET